VVVTDVVLVSAIMTDDIPRKFLSDHMFLTSSFMVYRKIKNCDKFGMTKSDKVDKIILKVPMSKYVPIIFEDGERTFRCSVPTLFDKK